jgi:hypothetical protein
MPLNRENGELIGELGPAYRVVPARKWMGTPFFEEAAAAAAKAFCASGAIMPSSGMRFDESQILAQEYPKANKLALVFVSRINGNEVFYPYIFTFPARMIAELVTTGHWDRSDN